MLKDIRSIKVNITFEPGNFTLVASGPKPSEVDQVR